MHDSLTKRLTVLLLLGSLLPGSGGATMAQQKQEPKIAKIGDITISKFNSQSFKTDFSSYHLTGPETIVEVPDKKSRSNLVLHADDINVDKANVRGGAVVDLKGHIRYTLTQDTPEGERVVKGTAGKANYQQANHRIELTGGAQTTLSDPQFIGPGVIRTGKMVIDISAAPYRYTLEGDAGMNDLRFTPRRAPKKGEKMVDQSDVGPVHIHHYDSGEFQAGKLAWFEGANTTADLTEMPDKTQAQLKSSRMEAFFAETGGEMVRAEATGNVHYHVTRMTPKREEKGAAKKEPVGSVKQEVVGTGRKVLYNVADSRIDLIDNVEATLTDGEALLAPAKLSAASVIVFANPTRYEIVGAPNHARLELRPRPAKPKAAVPPKPDADKPDGAKPNRPAAPPFMLGTITLTGFQKGSYEPGKKIALNGENLLLETKDTPTKSESNIRAQAVTADIAADGSIANAEATGKVRYFIQRPSPDGKTLQSIKGTALSTGYAASAAPDGGEKTEIFKVQGPFEAEITDPENLAEPGHATGMANDVFTLNLATREFAFDSPARSIVLIFVPREKPPAADTKTEAKPEKKPSKKPE